MQARVIIPISSSGFDGPNSNRHIPARERATNKSCWRNEGEQKGACAFSPCIPDG
jgi:hypothetical protein